VNQKTIVLLSCVSQKLPLPAPAGDLYVSALFRKALRYAKSLSPDAIYVLSAKHGLLKLDQEVAPYDLTLNQLGIAEVRSWADSTTAQLEAVTNLASDRFIILAGERYRRFIVPRLRFTEIPLKGLSIGKQLQFLTKAIHE
jgi:hypothetical protein